LGARFLFCGKSGCLFAKTVIFMYVSSDQTFKTLWRSNMTTRPIHLLALLGGMMLPQLLHADQHPVYRLTLSPMFSGGGAEGGGSPPPSGGETEPEPPVSAGPCTTPGQSCETGSATFAGGTYMYFDGKFAPQRWDQANAFCTGLGSGWRLLNSPTERNLLAIPGDPAEVDGVTLWGEAAIIGISNTGFPSFNNVCTWGARRYIISSASGDGNFTLHSPWGTSQDYFTLGNVVTSNACNTTTPPVNAQTYNFVCVLVTAEPLD
jgi:hypothetical protein